MTGASAAVAATGPMCWTLKGEGNANIVLAYVGDDPILKGTVLRLRKAACHTKQQQHTSSSHCARKAHQLQPIGTDASDQQQEQHQQLTCQHHQQDQQDSTSTCMQPAAASLAAGHAALEAAVWQPVIPDWPHLDPMQRELAFVRRVLQPHFRSCSRCCRLSGASAQLVDLPAALAASLQQQGHDLQPGVLGLLMPDSSVLHPGCLPPGYHPAGPCLCVEIKPKSGVMPHPAAAAVPPDSIKRIHPRFVLHQLLKHQQGKAPHKSYYNPQDLFMTNRAALDLESSSSSSSSRGVPAATSSAASCSQQRQNCCSRPAADYAREGTEVWQQQQQQQQPPLPPPQQQRQQQQGIVNQPVLHSAAPEGVLRRQLLRQQAAVLALLECPSNNLKLFLDGVMVLGTHKHKTAHNTPRGALKGQAAALAPAAPAEAEPPDTSNEIPVATAALDADRAGGTQQQKPHHAAAAAAAPPPPPAASTAAAGACDGVTTNSSRTSTAGGAEAASVADVRTRCFGHLLRQLPSGLLEPPTTQGHAAQSAAAAAGDGSTCSGGPANTTAAAAAATERRLCRLLCGVLRASGVLPALLSVQQLDQADVAAIEPLYQQLLQQYCQQQDQLQHTGLQQQQQQQVPACCARNRPTGLQTTCCEPGMANGVRVAQERQQSGQQQQQQQQLQQLRDYLTAVTAKDCAVMITLQHVVQQQQQQQQQQVRTANGNNSSSSSCTQAPSAGCTSCCCSHASPSVNHSNSDSCTGGGCPDGSGGCDGCDGSGGCDGCSSPDGSGAVGLYTDPTSGCCFAWQMSLVDLDLKPVSKVPVHAALDSAVTAAAAAAPQALQQHLQDSREWVEAACAWLETGGC